MKTPQPLLGPARLTDLAINIVLPWLWSRFPEKRPELQRCYLEWPAAEDNSLLRLARQRLLGTNSRKALANAAAQQGLLQIVRDFCEHSNALCHHCRFPELVKSWNQQAPPQTDADTAVSPKQ